MIWDLINWTVSYLNIQKNEFGENDKNELHNGYLWCWFISLPRPDTLVALVREKRRDVTCL